MPVPRIYDSMVSGSKVDGRIVWIMRLLKGFTEQVHACWFLVDFLYGLQCVSGVVPPLQYWALAAAGVEIFSLMLWPSFYPGTCLSIYRDQVKWQGLRRRSRKSPNRYFTGIFTPNLSSNGVGSPNDGAGCRLLYFMPRCGLSLQWPPLYIFGLVYICSCSNDN